MSRQFISVSSITYAMKGKSILRNYGIYTDIIKTSKITAQKGCGYSLVVTKNADKALQILQDNNINILGVTEGEVYKWFI